jgi:hypothetical protein
VRFIGILAYPKKQERKCPLDTPKRMIERCEREWKGRRRDIEREGEIREREREIEREIEIERDRERERE